MLRRLVFLCGGYALLACCAVATAAEPTAAELVKAARELAKQPNGAAKADAMLERAASLDPLNGEALMYRANIEAFLVKSSMERAIGLYRESIAVDGGTRWESQYFLGKVLSGESRHAEAAEVLRAAVKLVPDNKAVVQELSNALAVTTLPVDARGNPVELPKDEQLMATLAKNLEEHEAEGAASCASFFCGSGSDASADGAAAYTPPSMDSYSMGPVPSNDFPHAFDAATDQIFVSKAPLFTAAECEEVISFAEAEGNGMPAASSGKYAIGRAWVKEMPSVLSWFNGALERRLFPTLKHLFGDLIVDPSTLRAHTVLVAKYNASDTTARSDVHVDDALLALTIALSPPASFTGGGTYFEHLNRTIDMPQGHVTFRPGSVRHAGAPIDTGLRYVIGAFIAVADKVEHVRRLVERGNRLLMLVDAGQAGEEHLKYASQLFQWGLTLNANCTLCHQSLGDVQLRLGQPKQAEASMRAQIALLPYEADGHFALGVALRRQGRNREAVEAYEAALALAPSDSEGYINLASSLSELGEHEREVEAYRHALRIDAENAIVWMNLAGVLGTNLRRPHASIAAYRRAASAYVAQGAYSDIEEHFGAASRSLTRPDAAEAAAALKRIAAGARRVSEGSLRLEDHASGACGKPCAAIGSAEPSGEQDVDDAARACASSWAQHCGAEHAPPAGFEASAAIAEVCARTCAADALERHAAKIDMSKVRK